MHLNHLFSNSNRTELSNVKLEWNQTSRAKLRTEQHFFFYKQLNLLNKNPFPGEKIRIKFFANKLFASKKKFVEKNHNISFFFWQYFCPKKFANFLSNFELLRTSNLRYKNANFRTRTKFECISTQESQRQKLRIHNFKTKLSASSFFNYTTEVPYIFFT